MGERTVVFADVADGMLRSAESVQSTVRGALFEPVIRLGVTGLARSGKTVFVTSLVANLLERNRMGHVSAIREGRLLAAYLQPQPDDTVPRFDYEAHLATLAGSPPAWPESTRSISELRLSIRVQPRTLLSGLTGPRIVHIDIVDYPGEWLLDLQLLEMDYATWSANVIAKARKREDAGPFLARLDAFDPKDAQPEPMIKEIAEAFTRYLGCRRDAGLSDITPGRFLLPGDLAGSPALTFFPLGRQERPDRKSAYREMERRFEAYKSQVVKPFFRDHFAKIDRQIVLVDVLGAIHAGPEALEDLRVSLAGTLSAFRTGRNSFLSQLFLGRKIDRILFAATKADHLHHRQHRKLAAIAQALLSDARSKAEFSGAKTDAMAIAALRATVEETRRHDGRSLDLVRGTLLDGRNAALFAGELPEDPSLLLGDARSGEGRWLNADYNVMSFAPPSTLLKPGSGPAHIRLDRAAEFLFGDKL